MTAKHTINILTGTQEDENGKIITHLCLFAVLDETATGRREESAQDRLNVRVQSESSPFIRSS